MKGKQILLRRPRRRQRRRSEAEGSPKARLLTKLGKSEVALPEQMKNKTNDQENRNIRDTTKDTEIRRTPKYEY